MIEDRNSKHENSNSQDYDDCQLLQLTDLLVGCFRTALGNSTRDIHRELSLPVKQLVQRYREGYARMRNSRWHNAFTLSQCFIEEGQWKFESLDFPSGSEKQLSLL